MGEVDQKSRSRERGDREENGRPSLKKTLGERRKLGYFCSSKKGRYHSMRKKQRLLTPMDKARLAD